jgi:hypothetical protein
MRFDFLYSMKPTDPTNTIDNELKRYEKARDFAMPSHTKEFSSGRNNPAPYFPSSSVSIGNKAAKHY